MTKPSDRSVASVPSCDGRGPPVVVASAAVPRGSVRHGVEAADAARRHGLRAALGLGLSLPLSLLLPARALAAPGADDPAGTGDAPDCAFCQARLGTLEALREAMPPGWALRREPDPVFGGQVLVVTAGRPSAPPLLLVHGLGQNGFTDWLPVMPTLAERYRVIAVDLPGYGYSDSPEGKYAPRRYAQVLDAVLARHARGPATVLGHSMGGAAALRLAEAAPERVAALVLSDVAGVLHRTAFVKHRASLPWTIDQVPPVLKAPLARARDLGNVMVEKLFGLPDVTRVLRDSDRLWGSVLAGRSDVNAGWALIDEDFSALLHTLGQPVSILWGERDEVAPLRTGQAMAFALPRARLQVIEGADHSPMFSAIARFLPALLAAIAQAPSGRADVAPVVQAGLGAGGSDPRPVPVGDGAAPPDLALSRRIDQTLAGRWRELRLVGCTGIRLRGVSVERLVVQDSIVDAVDLDVRGGGGPVGLEVQHSEFVATASRFAGETAIRADHGRLDLAGVQVAARRTAVDVLGRSRVIASVSEVQSPAYRGWWHGSHELENAVVVPGVT